MKIRESIPSAPIQTELSVRGDEIRALTSCKAGKVIPVSFIPLLREDRVSRGSVRLSLEMAETLYPLMNAVNVTAYAHFVPFLAFERFNGSMDAFNRSYQGMPEPATGTPIPFFPTLTYLKSHAFWKALGVHWKDSTPINMAPVHAYNEIVNFRRKARSKHLPLRDSNDRSTLAEAFWKNPNLWHIVPDYDQAAMDGEVDLQFVNPKLTIQGIGRGAAYTPTTTNLVASERGPDGLPRSRTYAYAQRMSEAAALYVGTGDTGVPAVFAELQETGVRLSLANIELAKQTAAFAKLRQQFSGLDDDHIIDLLMEGIRVPDEAMKQPILLDRKSTIFGYSERFATDAENLEKSVTTGHTELTLNFRTPPMNTGGVIMITVEIVPEQLFERMEDNFLAMTDPAKLPNFMRDFLDPEKVEIVQNKYVDVLHGTPSATFGYAPLNHAWKRSYSRVGGRYMRPETAGFIEDRQRFWSVEQLNPTLTNDFYLVPNSLPHTVFKDQIADPFEILALGQVEIVGNTVFGKTLEEDTGDYNAVMDQVDQSRIVQP